MMDVFFHDDFYQVYTSDPAAESGRMESIVEAITGKVKFLEAKPLEERFLNLVHTREQIERVKRQGVYEIALLAAGGAYQTALLGLEKPSFGLVRPPGHHASSGNAWGFCFFNNMAIAIEALKSQKLINSAAVIDIDMHYGDGTENILKDKEYVKVFNFETEDRKVYLEQVDDVLNSLKVDIIGISAGFDNHIDDWGRVLYTKDYSEIGKLSLKAAEKNNAGLFAILEGGYNHRVLGQNVLALIEGMKGN